MTGKWTAVREKDRYGIGKSHDSFNRSHKEVEPRLITK